MLKPSEMTQAQQVIHGLRILEGYLSHEKPGRIAAVSCAIQFYGVHLDRVGDYDVTKLMEAGWWWNATKEFWCKEL